MSAFFFFTRCQCKVKQKGQFQIFNKTFQIYSYFYSFVHGFVIFDQ